VQQEKDDVKEDRYTRRPQQATPLTRIFDDELVQDSGDRPRCHDVIRSLRHPVLSFEAITLSKIGPLP